MAIEGMNVDDVRRRAAHLNELGSEVARIGRSLENILDWGSTWIGPDADQASNILTSEVVPALTKARSFIEATANSMSNNADAQEAASNNY